MYICIYVGTMYNIIIISLCSFCLIMKMVAELLSTSVETETAVVDHDKDKASSALPLWQDACIHKEAELK